MKTAEEVLDSYYNESGFELHKLQRIWALLAMEEYASLRTSKLEELAELYEEITGSLIARVDIPMLLYERELRRKIIEFRKELNLK